jgi:hypothetical protein
MTSQPFPDLTPLGLSVIPMTGLGCGEGLFLHRGGFMPELADALGFAPSPDGYVIPASRHGRMQDTVAAVAAKAAALLPRIRFVSLDPRDISFERRHAHKAGGDATVAAEELNHRNRIRAALAEAEIAPAPDPVQPGSEADDYRELRTIDVVTILERTLSDVLDEDAPDDILLPHTQTVGERFAMFVRRQGDGVVVGFGRDETDMRRTVLVKAIGHPAGDPWFIATGSGVDLKFPSARVMVDQLSDVLSEFEYELVTEEHGTVTPKQLAEGMRLGIPPEAYALPKGKVYVGVTTAQAIWEASQPSGIKGVDTSPEPEPEDPSPHRPF